MRDEAVPRTDDARRVRMTSTGRPVDSGAAPPRDRPHRTIDGVLRVWPIGEGRFTSRVAGAGERLFGGEVASQAALAAGATVPDGRNLHSLQAQYLRPGDTTKPVEFSVDVVRDGRSFSARHVEASQDGQTILAAMASFAVAANGPAHQHSPRHTTSPDEIPGSGDGLDAEPAGRAFVDDVGERVLADMRFPDGLRQQSRQGGGPHTMTTWLRLRGRVPADHLHESAGLVYLSDLFMLSAIVRSHPHGVDDPRLQVATINHTVWVHRNARPDQWLLYEVESDWASDGRGLARGKLFAQDGTLCASTAQEGLMRTR